MDMLSMLLISEGILTYRTWAVWGRDTRIGILMWIVFFFFFAGSAAAAILAIKGLICTSPIPSPTKCDAHVISSQQISDAYQLFCWMFPHRWKLLYEHRLDAAACL
jgi:hypothetical protein